MTAEIQKLERELAVAQQKSHKAMEARMRLKPGSTRARVTTANANWARAAEHRDFVKERLERALEASGDVVKAVNS